MAAFIAQNWSDLAWSTQDHKSSSAWQCQCLNDSSVFVLPIIGEAIEDPCDEGSPLAAQSHKGVIVAKDPVFKVVIFKLGHVLNCIILKRYTIHICRRSRLSSTIWSCVPVWGTDIGGRLRTSFGLPPKLNLLGHKSYWRAKPVSSVLPCLPFLSEPPQPWNKHNLLYKAVLF